MKEVFLRSVMILTRLPRNSARRAIPTEAATASKSGFWCAMTRILPLAFIAETRRAEIIRDLILVVFWTVLVFPPKISFSVSVFTTTWAPPRCKASWSALFAAASFSESVPFMRDMPIETVIGMLPASSGDSSEILSRISNLLAICSSINRSSKNMIYLSRSYSLTIPPKPPAQSLSVVLILALTSRYLSCIPCETSLMLSTTMNATRTLASVSSSFILCNSVISFQTTSV